MYPRVVPVDGGLLQSWGKHQVCGNSNSIDSAFLEPYRSVHGTKLCLVLESSERHSMSESRTPAGSVVWGAINSSSCTWSSHEGLYRISCRRMTKKREGAADVFKETGALEQVSSLEIKRLWVLFVWQEVTDVSFYLYDVIVLVIL